jgi:hypothetical protein
MDSEPHDVEKQASAIAHAFFWSVAGRHQAGVEQLQDISGAVPNEVWLTLCFEPLLFGLSFFGEYARKRYTAPEQELFMAELETATRWLLATTVFQPDDVGFAPSQMPQSVRIGQPARSRWVLTKGQERALAPFSRWCEARQRQFHRRFDRFWVKLFVLLTNVFGWRFQGQTNPPSDSGRLFEELRMDLTRDGYRCPEAVLRVFAQGVVSEAYRIRGEAISAVLDGLFSARLWQQVDTGHHSHRPTRARTG